MGGTAWLLEKQLACKTAVNWYNMPDSQTNKLQRRTALELGISP